MKVGSSMHENILLEKARQGDPDAYAEIFNLYADRIYRYIYFKVSTREESEDIASDVFLKVWQYISSQGKEINNIKAFLYQTSRNAVIDYYRRRSQSDVLYEREDMEMISDVKQQRLIDEIEINSTFKKLEVHISELKDDYRDVILLRYIEEMSVKEISVIMNKSGGAVRVLIHRALKILRDKIDNNLQS